MLEVYLMTASLVVLPLAACASSQTSNRRVDFRLMRGDVNLVLEEGVHFDDHGNLLGGRTAGAER